MRESSISPRIQMEAALHYNATLLRNNNGACQDKTGRLIRYGLGHTKPDQELRSSDLIGWTPVVITPDMVGKTVAVFTAVEVKTEGWTHPTDERERGQQRFVDLVRNSGGLSIIATSVRQVLELLSFTRR